MNQQFNQDVYQSDWKPKTWNGFRLCAIDGTSIRLPDEVDIIEHFGEQKGRPEQGRCTMGMASIFYDVLNTLFTDPFLLWIMDRLNNRPRKALQGKTPNEVFFTDERIALTS